jgi:adenine-specific DNA-methyltransferase
MTTKPGELILDPTCGSGTTAYAAEKLGRRWITIDTSRVAVAFARQRLLTEKFDFFELKNVAQSVAGGFKYETAPHITLKSIAHNQNLDAIFVKHQVALDAALRLCNEALAEVSLALKRDLRKKLDDKMKRDGKRVITDADRRRWLLPPANRDEEANWIVDPQFGGWYPWEVPFDADPDWPHALRDAVNGYRATWCLKMADVNACIKVNAKPEELLDEPVVRPGVVRVSGPFTIEAVQPQELSLEDSESPIAGEPEPDEAAFDIEQRSDAPIALQPQADSREADVKNADSYIDNMIRLLRIDGVRFPDNKEMRFSRLDAIGARSTTIHAEGRWGTPRETDPDPEGRATVCVAFGPQYGPVTAAQVEILIRAASRRGYDDLLIAGFAFDGTAQTVIEDADHPHIRIHMAHIRPDVNPAMNGLLKETAGSQLFSVFGRPRTEVQGPAKDGTYAVRMQGVDIYDPVTNTIDASRADKVAAWFLDTDYDGRTFCITQAFFPDKSAWDKLAKALKGTVDETAFAALAGTVSLSFHAGEHMAVAVKVIDPRGNEVMRVHRLG